MLKESPDVKSNSDVLAQSAIDLFPDEPLKAVMSLVMGAGKIIMLGCDNDDEIDSTQKIVNRITNKLIPVISADEHEDHTTRGAQMIALIFLLCEVCEFAELDVREVFSSENNVIEEIIKRMSSL